MDLQILRVKTNVMDIFVCKHCLSFISSVFPCGTALSISSLNDALPEAPSVLSSPLIARKPDVRNEYPQFALSKQ